MSASGDWNVRRWLDREDVRTEKMNVSSVLWLSAVGGGGRRMPGNTRKRALCRRRKSANDR